MPWISTISGTLSEIISSCTLVPNGYEPNVRPSFRVVDPAPEADSFDLSTITEFTLFLIFTLDLGFSFLSVAINVAPVSLAPKLRKLIDFPPFEKTSLSAVRTSVDPSVLIRAYLSSSNAVKVSLSPPVTTEDSVLLAILTVNSFLILILADVKSTLETFALGSAVYSVLSEDATRFVPRSVKSCTSICVATVPPMATPVTVVTPAIVT